MKILITGINGMLGSELVGALERDHEVSGLDISGHSGGHEVHNVDLSDYRATFNIITKLNPDAVIHTAANSSVDKCEAVPDLAYRMNSLATRNVALACQRFDAAMLYISTDYVFSGKQKAGETYNEFDAPAPINVYGGTKLAGETFVKEMLSKFYIVRTSWLFGKLRANYITQAADALRDGKSIALTDGMFSCPTYARDLALALKQLVESGIFGTYHITNSGAATRHEIGLEVARIMKKPPKCIKKVSLSKLGLAAARPKRSAMDNYVWKLSGFEPLRPWKEAALEFLKEKGYI